MLRRDGQALTPEADRLAGELFVAAVCVGAVGGQDKKIGRFGLEAIALNSKVMGSSPLALTNKIRELTGKK